MEDIYQFAALLEVDEFILLTLVHKQYISDKNKK
jgi:hypothetical protein